MAINPLQEKRDKQNSGYKDSRLWLSSDLAKCEKWNLEEIRKRTERLTKSFLKIWPYPQVSSVARKDTEEVNIFDAESPTHKRLEYAIFHDQTLHVTYYEVIRGLFKQNPQAFVGTALGQKIGLYKTSDANRFRQPIAIDELYSIESNIDSVNKFDRIKLALEVFNMEDELFIKYANETTA